MGVYGTPLDKGPFGGIANILLGAWNYLTGREQQQNWLDDSQPLIDRASGVPTRRGSLGSGGWEGSGNGNNAVIMDVNPAYRDALVASGMVAPGFENANNLPVGTNPSEQDFGRMFLQEDAAREAAESRRVQNLHDYFNTASENIRGANQNMQDTIGSFDTVRQEGNQNLDAAKEQAIASVNQATAEAQARIDAGVQRLQNNYASFEGKISETIDKVWNNVEKVSATLEEGFVQQAQAFLDGENQAARQDMLAIDQNVPPGQRDAMKEMRRDIASKRVSMAAANLQGQHDQYKQQTMTSLTNQANATMANLVSTLGSYGAAANANIAGLEGQGAAITADMGRVGAEVHRLFAESRANWNSGMLVAKVNAQTAAVTNMINGEQTLFTMANMLPEDYVTVSDAFGEFMNFSGSLNDEEYARIVADYNLLSSQFQVGQVPFQSGQNAGNQLMGGSFAATQNAGYQEDIAAMNQPNAFQQYVAPFIPAMATLGGASIIAGATGAPSLVSNGVSAAANTIPGGSHSAFKRDFRSVDEKELLSKATGLPVKRWKYKPETGWDQDDHLGPMAEEFRKAFGLPDGMTINPLDSFGAALACIKALKAEVDELRAKIEEAR